MRMSRALMTFCILAIGACESQPKEIESAKKEADVAKEIVKEEASAIVGIEEKSLVKVKPAEDSASPKAEVSSPLKNKVKVIGRESRGGLVDHQKGFDSKINVAMSGEGGELQVARGTGGMGLSGVGRGGGGKGYGRIGGLGKVTSGRVRGAKLGKRKAFRRNTESYKKYKVNQHTKTSDDKFSTFSIDVDTGSYTIGRKKLNAGYLPPSASVRPEEYLNYFKYNYPAPEKGAFAVHLEGAPTPFSTEANKYILRVGVQGKTLKKKERKPAHLTFLVDVSGSMRSHDKLPLAKRSLKLLVDNLQKGDTVALSTYAGASQEVLPPTGVEKKTEILNAIGNLRRGGGTAMASGMESAYKSAMKNFKKNHINRVIVLSDGDANIGPKSHEAILSRIRHFAQEGVSLSTIGFGMGNYKDTMMEQLANKGNGNYYYVDSYQEAKKVFGAQVNGTLQIIAKDVKVQVEFDPKKVKNYRLVGYENRDIADEDFRNDRVDAGEIGAGHSVTALYEIQLYGKPEGKLATVRIRAKKPQGSRASELAFDFNEQDIRRKLSDASSDFQFQMGVVEFAEVLRKSPYAEGLTLDLVREVVKPVIGRSDQRKEFLALIERASELRK